jgi:erythromycin esterase-like protein
VTQAPSGNDQNWVRALSIPLRTLDPDDTDYSDLEPLRAIVGDARLVAIGESTHQTREFYFLRHRLARFLIGELGFDAFAMESGFAEGLIVNDWVHGGTGDLAQIAQTGITYGFGEPDEVQQQLQWLRQWNSTHSHKVSFYGIDVSGSGSTPRPSIEACLRRLKPEAGDDELLRLSDLGIRRVDAATRYQGMTPQEREQLSAGVSRLAERALAAGDQIAYRCAECAVALEQFIKSGRALRPDWNPRDQAMAQNVSWMLERHQRVVVGAHNGHVQRGFFLTAPMMGQYLASTLGNDMLVVGTTYASGRVGRKRPTATGRRFVDMEFAYDELQPPPPRTTDALMDSAGLPLHMLDLRRVSAERLAGTTTMLAMHDEVEIDPRQSFDVLIHVQHVTPVAGERSPVYL